jgi:hypothetical protein
MRESYISLCRKPIKIHLSYDIFAINIASTMLGYVYGKGTVRSPIYLNLGS